MLIIPYGDDDHRNVIAEKANPRQIGPTVLKSGGGHQRINKAKVTQVMQPLIRIIGCISELPSLGTTPTLK